MKIRWFPITAALAAADQAAKCYAENKLAKEKNVRLQTRLFYGTFKTKESV